MKETNIAVETDRRMIAGVMGEVSRVPYRLASHTLRERLTGLVTQAMIPLSRSVRAKRRRKKP